MTYSLLPAYAGRSVFSLYTENQNGYGVDPVVKIQYAFGK